MLVLGTNIAVLLDCSSRLDSVAFLTYLLTHRCAGEYLPAARAADRQYSAPGTNPILDRLRSFGQTRGLAFGAYGEASPDVHALLTVAGAGSAGRALRALPPSALTHIRILQISTTLTVDAKIHEYCELFMIIRSLSIQSHDNLGPLYSKPHD